LTMVNIDWKIYRGKIYYYEITKLIGMVNKV
jgi:hypothetical protein